MATAFFALPELNASGENSQETRMVTEWQQSEGRLIAGGSTPVIRCWDLESEKCKITIDSQIQDSCATCFVTAWDYVQSEPTSPSVGGFSGMGPDIFIGGYGDGRIKVYDLRMRDKQGAAATMTSENTKAPCRSRSRFHKDYVHKNWIVNIAYTHSCNEVRFCIDFPQK